MQQLLFTQFDSFTDYSTIAVASVAATAKYLPEVMYAMTVHFGSWITEMYLVCNLFYGQSEPTAPDNIVYDYNNQLYDASFSATKTSIVMQTSQCPQRL